MSFCRITGKAKGLPKPNYFPLLAPISPADARRFCRITGKSYGLPSHHFIPVILTTFSNRSKCRITNSTEYAAHSYGADINYGKRNHIVLVDYRYVYPVFDESDIQQRDLIEILNSKVVQHDNNCFVYAVGERKCKLVLSARLEAAVRDGDVRDVMLAKNSDSVLLKMKKGKSVSLDLQDFDADRDNCLFEGEGPREEVLLEREMNERDTSKGRLKRKESLLHMAKIFEGKERDSDKEMLKNMAIKEDKRQKMIARIADRKRKMEFSEFQSAASRADTHLYMTSGDWRDLVKPVIESWDWDTYEREASQINCMPNVSILPTPYDIKAEKLPLKELDIEDAKIQNTIGFDDVPCVTPLSPFLDKPQAELINLIENMAECKLKELENIRERVMEKENLELLQCLPTADDIPDILNKISAGLVKTINKMPVPGLSLDIGAARNLFVTGHVVSTPTGDIFVPGQSVQTSRGPAYVPGFTVNTPTGPSFIPGMVITNLKDPSTKVFAAGQIINHDFVFGQTIQAKFVEGQTVVTHEGLRFVAAPGNKSFIVEGFIPGQIIFTEDGKERFLPGQLVGTLDGPRFVPAKIVETGDQVIFFPGQIVQTDQGPRFVAADLSDDDNGSRFSVQSFLVSPEELTLIKPTHTWTASPHPKGELIIDAQILCQSSEAGMAIGRQIETSAVDIVLQSTTDMQTVKDLAQKLHIGGDNDSVELLENLYTKIKQMVINIQQKTENGIILEHKLNGLTNGFSSDIENGIDNESMHYLANGLANGSTHENPTMHLVNILSATILKCVTLSHTQNGLSQSNKNNVKPQNNSSSLYELISEILESNLASNVNATATTNGIGLFNITTIGQLLSSPVALEALECQVNQLVDQTIQISKVNLIKSTISKNIYNEAEIVKNICVALHQEEDMIEAVRNLSENEPKLLYRIIEHLKVDINELKDDASTVATLKKCIIAAVKESAINDINYLLTQAINPDAPEHGQLNVVLMETAALAKALGLNDISTSVTSMLGRPDTAKILLRDDNIMELVQRIVVMKKMATNDADLKECLLALHTDPFFARKDPNIRLLLRRSACCTIDSGDKIKLTDSNEVPISLFCSDNQLAMEDFLMHRQTKARGAFLIMKEGLQAVVPREASRDVLTGKCAYTVLDEDGIRHFEPLHVFSALKLTFPSSSHRFSIYSCDFADSNPEVESVLSSSGSAVSGDMKGLVLFAEKEKLCLKNPNDHTKFYNKRQLNDIYDDGRQVN